MRPRGLAALRPCGLVTVTGLSLDRGDRGDRGVPKGPYALLRGTPLKGPSMWAPTRRGPGVQGPVSRSSLRWPFVPIWPLGGLAGLCSALDWDWDWT